MKSVGLEVSVPTGYMSITFPDSSDTNVFFTYVATSMAFPFPVVLSPLTPAKLDTIQKNVFSYFHKFEDKIEVLFTPDTSSAWIVHHYGFDEWTVVFVLQFDCETTQIAAKHHGAVLNHRDSKMSLVGGRWNVRNVFRQKTQMSLLCW